MVGVPQVMISSTFFDLKHVRDELARVITDELGCRPVMSELPSFPIDPDADTIENCRRRVECDADILILIIGGRYGYVDLQSAKSVTNIEYLIARAKGIPIYAFVDRQVLTLLPTWKANKEGNFSHAVDDCRVFEFIDEVRNQNKVWMRDFDLAKDIAIFLRCQFAHLALKGAQLVKRTLDENEITALNQLHGRPLRIALEKPPAWNYKLFAEILIQEVGARRALGDQQRLGIAYGSFYYIDSNNLGQWHQSRLAELRFIIHAFGKLMNEELSGVFRSRENQDEPVSVESILRTARSLATLYEETLQWCLRVRRSIGEDGISELAHAMEHLADDILKQLEGLGFRIRQEVEELLDAVNNGKSGTRKIIFDLTLPGTDKAEAALSQLVQKLLATRQNPRGRLPAAITDSYKT